MAGKNDERVIYLEERKAHEEAAVSNNAKARRFDEILMENKRISETYINGSAGVTTPTATTPAAAAPQKAMTYEEYLSQYGKNPEYVQAQSYADYLTRTGMAGAAQKQYDATVRAAETDYEKSKAMYGANAEALGRAGLTGSGYGDYLTGAGFSAMQGAKVAAADTKALTEAQQRSDYANYLMGVEQTNAQIKAQADAANEQGYAAYMNRGNEAKGVIDSLMSQGMDDASIKAYIQQHYGTEFDGYVDGWISNAHTYSDPLIAEAEAKTTEAETEAANAEALERAQAAYSALLEGYQSGAIVNKATAESELKRAGFTQAEIDAAVAEYGTGVIQRLSTNMNLSGATLADVPTSAQIDDLMATDQITPAQAVTFKAEAQKKRTEILKRDYKNITGSTVAQYMQDLSNFYKSDDISKEDFANLMGQVVEANIRGVADEGEPATAAVNMIFALRNNPEYKDIIKDLEERIIGAMKVEKSIPTTAWGIGKNGIDHVSIDVTFGNNSNGKASTQRLILEASKKESPVDLGKGEQGEIKGKDGKLYVYDSAIGKWKEIVQITERSSGSKEVSTELYNMLVKLYGANA